MEDMQDKNGQQLIGSRQKMERVEFLCKWHNNDNAACDYGEAE